MYWCCNYDQHADHFLFWKHWIHEHPQFNSVHCCNIKVAILWISYHNITVNSAITLQAPCCWSHTWSESRLPLLSRCWAPRAHWLSMSSAVIWTDWASQLSNKELSNGKDFDKPEGRGRDISREDGGRKTWIYRDRGREWTGVAKGRKLVGMKVRKTERERRGRRTKQTGELCCTLFINKKHRKSCTKSVSRV